MESMDIVDTNNQVIGECTRNEIYKNGYNHRIAHILLFDDDNRMALQRRAKTVSYCPDYWVTSAGGHVKAQETYSHAASREMKEEIGVMTPLDFAFHLEFPFGQATKFLSVFTAKSNSVQKIDIKYVSNMGFLSLSDIFVMIKGGEKFHPELLFIIDNLFF